MKIFECRTCGMAAYFDNTTCVHCGSRLGYDAASSTMQAIAPDGDGWLDRDGRSWRLCANAAYDACNWLLPADDGAQRFCLACRFNRTVPDLSLPDTRENWRRIEAAKRHLFYSLLRWQLPMPGREQDPAQGLAFDLLADVTGPDGAVETVMTGHADGLITINVAEGDDAEREKRRAAMNEPYRTLLGHFRHEIGHYYWDRLVRDGGRLEGFRALFGDEREDYGAALRRHYENGPAPGWQDSFISSYAAAHPWEDFAETWAHYIHIVDTLETAEAFGMRVRHPDVADPGRLFDPYLVRDVGELLQAWIPLTVAMNAVNRSMGQPDLYPFVLSEPVTARLQFICELVLENGAAANENARG